MAKKLIAILMLFPILVITSYGCVSEEDYKSEYIYYWSGNEYSLYDPFGNHIESQWQFPIVNRKDLTKVRIYFGPASNKDKKPNVTVKRFEDPTLDMLLVEWDELLCKKGYLPNYHEVEEIEDIYTYQSNTYDVDFFGVSSKSIHDKKSVNKIYQELKKIAETNDGAVNELDSENLSEFEEIHIGLKFYDVVAIYDMGYITKLAGGQWGLYLYDQHSLAPSLLPQEVVDVFKLAKII